MRASDKRQIEAKLNNEVDHIVGKTVKNYEIEKNLIEQQRVEAMQNRHETGKTTEEIEAETAKKHAVQDAMRIAVEKAGVYVCYCRVL